MPLRWKTNLLKRMWQELRSGAIHDNIQKLHTANKGEDYDSLIYTSPKVSPLTRWSC